MALRRATTAWSSHMSFPRARWSRSHSRRCRAPASGRWRRRRLGKWRCGSWLSGRIVRLPAFNPRQELLHFDLELLPASQALDDVARFHLVGIHRVELPAVLAGEGGLLRPEVEIVASFIVPAIVKSAAG